MKDAPTTKPNKDGSYFKQFFDVFNFKKLKGNPHNKEMLLANLVACFFFIPFNFYFVHMGNWLIYDIGFTAGDMGLIQGIALLFAVLVTIPFARLINKNHIPLVALVAVAVNALGLLILFFFVKEGQASTRPRSSRSKTYTSSRCFPSGNRLCIDHPNLHDLGSGALP
jgi:hypothetical protein